MADKSDYDSGVNLSCSSYCSPRSTLYEQRYAPSFGGDESVCSFRLLAHTPPSTWPPSHIAMKLSSTLKSVTTAAEARLEPTPAPPRIRDIFSKIEREAEARRLSLWSWLVVLTATTITMNSPESMTALFQHSSASKPLTEGVAIAEFMREVGLRCMGINGV